MKKENVRKMTMLLLAMGLMGIGNAVVQAADPITITSSYAPGDPMSVDSLYKEGILGYFTESYIPAKNNDENHIIIKLNDPQQMMAGFDIAAGMGSFNKITIYNGTFGKLNSGNRWEKLSIYGSHYGLKAESNIVEIHGGTFNQGVYGGEATGDGSSVKHNEVHMDGGQVNGYIAGGWLTAGQGEISDNQVFIEDRAQVGTVYGGHSHIGTSKNTVTVNGEAKVSIIYGGYSSGSGEISDNSVIIKGNTKITNKIYGGYGSQGSIINCNTVSISENADVSGANLYGSNLRADQTDGNALIIDGWNSSSANGNAVKNVKNFNAITFKNLAWKNGGIALNITGAAEDEQLKYTQVNVEDLTLAGGAAVKAGDKMTFIQSNLDTGLSMDHVQLTEDTSFSQGVATVGELDVKLEGETNNLVGEIKSVSFNPQTDVIAENRTAAAAFLNQGADIAADSLDLLGSDYKYGLRTFGSVYGNRSTYDTAGDVKINGWSEIVGLGNVHRKGDGDLAWGVFYENGTGNYRTWNQFNNEMFRGDGSLRYNGGGAAVRYTRDSGWYYEASVRAGTLTASMENAVKDGDGNSYGFDNDSTYWGVHAGIGRLIKTGRGEWDLYGKYFHTDIEGSSFSIAKDRFVFDSLTSDRLRLGARYTADQTKQWSLYYGLGWEYEFSGDSHMRAAQWDAPEQSLGGSTGIAEIGTVWKPDDSPWQADINVKGYIGEREGFSGRVQLSYTF